MRSHRGGTQASLCFPCGVTDVMSLKSKSSSGLNVFKCDPESADELTLPSSALSFLACCTPTPESETQNYKSNATLGFYTHAYAHLCRHPIPSMASPIILCSPLAAI